MNAKTPELSALIRRTATLGVALATCSMVACSSTDERADASERNASETAPGSGDASASPAGGAGSGGEGSGDSGLRSELGSETGDPADSRYAGRWRASPVLGVTLFMDLRADGSAGFSGSGFLAPSELDPGFEGVWAPIEAGERFRTSFLVKGKAETKTWRILSFDDADPPKMRIERSADADDKERLRWTREGDAPAAG